MLTPMKFRDFTWPNNPHSFSVEHRRALKSRKLPFQAYKVQDMGEDLCVFKGEGEFVGDSAYADFLRLAELFIDGSPGLLVHPVWPATQVYFASLKLRQEPKENYVNYEFEFWQDSSGKKRSNVKLKLAPTAYILQSGEGIGDVILQSGVSAEEILMLNPQIENMNRLGEGDVLKLSQEV